VAAETRQIVADELYLLEIQELVMIYYAYCKAA